MLGCAGASGALVGTGMLRVLVVLTCITYRQAGLACNGRSNCDKFPAASAQLLGSTPVGARPLLLGQMRCKAQGHLDYSMMLAVTLCCACPNLLCLAD